MTGARPIAASRGRALDQFTMFEPNRPRVVIADDYPSIVATLQRLLSPHCDVVATASDVGSLLVAVGRLQPDIVLLDLNLPGGSSLLACQEITRTPGGPRVIVLTGDPDSTFRTHVLDAGASAFIDKFAMSAELLPAMARVLAS
jgi:CheY-like chemotaxis protein